MSAAVAPDPDSVSWPSSDGPTGTPRLLPVEEHAELCRSRTLASNRSSSRTRSYVTVTFDEAKPGPQQAKQGPEEDIRLQLSDAAKVRMDDICVRRYCACYSAFVQKSDGRIDKMMERNFARAKYVHFHRAFIQVSFLMPLGVLGLAINAAVLGQRPRIAVLLGGVAPAYLACAIFALRRHQQYLEMSNTPAERLLVGLLCLQSFLIAMAEWLRPQLDYGMLVMHIGYVHNFTPLSAGAMQLVTAAFGLLPYSVFQLLRWLSDQGSGGGTTTPAGGSADCEASKMCCRAASGESAIFSVAVPLVILIYQVVVTMRRDESLRLDALSNENLRRQQRLLAQEQEKNEGMLGSMLPRQLITALKASEHVDPQFYEDVTVIFVEICQFPRLCWLMEPSDVVELLNIIYLEFDRISDLLNVYKVETVGQVYMAVVGCPDPISNHADVAAHFGLAVQQSMRHMRPRIDKIVARARAPTRGRSGTASTLELLESAADEAPAVEDGLTVQVRVGLNTGELRAGVVGIDSPRYKLFGDTVNTASRMESTCEPGKVQVSTTTWDRLSQGMFVLQDRGKIPVKGKGKMHTAFLVGYAEGDDTQGRRIMIERTQVEKVGVSSESLMVQVTHSFSLGLFTSTTPKSYAMNRSLSPTPEKGEMELLSYSGGPETPADVTSPVSAQSSQGGLQRASTVKLVRGALAPEAQTRGEWAHRGRLGLCWERLQDLLLLVPSSQKRPGRLAELRTDRPVFEGLMLKKHLSYARNLTLMLLLVPAMLSGIDYLMEGHAENLARYRSAVLFRAFGNNVVGLMYLLLITTPSMSRRLAQHLTILMLLVQCLALLVCGVVLYDSDSVAIAMAAMYGAYALFYTVLTLAQRLALCALAVAGYVAVKLGQCGFDGVLGAAQNIGFLIVLVVSMASGVRLQEHLQHVSHYEQRGATERLQGTKQAKQAGSQLLTSLLPEHVVSLVRDGVSPIAEHYSDVTIMFTDIKGFTDYSSRVTPHELFTVLNAMYSAFDEIIANWALYKVEIIGDAYFVSAGCPARSGEAHRADPSEFAMRAVEVALALQRTLPSVCDDSKVQMRVGIHTGSVVAGVVGKKGPRYHLFGAAVGYAEQMESSGIPGRVQISDATHKMLTEGGHPYDFEERTLELDDEEGPQRTWLVNRSNSNQAKQIQKKLMTQRRRNSLGDSGTM